MIPPSRESRHRSEADDLSVTSTAAPSVALDQLEDELVRATRARNDARLLWRARLAFALSGGHR